MSNKWLDSPAGRELEKTLSQEETLNALNRILMRMDKIEDSLAKVTDLVTQAPSLTSIAVDSVDGIARSATQNGVDIDERMRNALSIAERLTSTEMVEKLDGLFKLVSESSGLISMGVDTVDGLVRDTVRDGVSIDDRLRSALSIAEKLTAPAMVEKLESLLALANEAPGLISMGVDSIDGLAREANTKGVNLDDRLRSTLNLVEKITAPEMITKLEGMIEMAENSSGLLSIGVDSLDGIMRTAIERGIDPQVTITKVIEMGSKLSELLNSPEMTTIMESGIMDPKTIKIVGAAAEALVETNAKPIEKVGGIFALMKVMKDENMQKTLGFLTAFGKEFGKKMK